MSQQQIHMFVVLARTLGIWHLHTANSKVLSFKGVVFLTQELPFQKVVSAPLVVTPQKGRLELATLGKKKRLCVKQIIFRSTRLNECNIPIFIPKYTKHNGYSKSGLDEFRTSMEMISSATVSTKFQFQK